MTTPTDGERAALRDVLRNTPQALAGHCVLEDVGDCPDCSDAILALLAGFRERIVRTLRDRNTSDADGAADMVAMVPLLPPPEHP